MKTLRAECVVVGAGPAGMAAAFAHAVTRRSSSPASSISNHTLLLDENPRVGGQIWRGHRGKIAQWARDVAESGVEHLAGVQVVSTLDANTLLVETSGQPLAVTYEKLIIASGARELFLPFPGWTLPGVMGVGGLQAMVKSGLDVRAKRVFVAGSGPLLPLVGAFLAGHGAKVLGIAEQAPRETVNAFARSLWRWPGKAVQGAFLRSRLLLSGIRYTPGLWPLRALGHGRVEQVVLSDGRREQTFNCDFLACAFGLVPNTQLASLLGCRVEHGKVAVDAQQRTSIDHVFAAGEVCGIGGVDAAAWEGLSAGYAAAGRPDLCPRGEVLRARAFAAGLDRAFALRPEVLSLADDQTLLCRCEDVPLGAVRACASWREAKIQTRCGMGPCQGRICGAAARAILGFEPADARPPLMPVRLSTLAGIPSETA